MVTVERIFFKITDVFYNLSFIFDNMLLWYLCLFLVCYLYYLKTKKLVIKIKPLDLYWLFALVIAFYFLSAFYYLFRYRSYLDHGESMVASISYLFYKGQDIYPRLDKDHLYLTGYGPMVYVINSLVFRILDPSIISAKIAGVAASLIACTFLFLCYLKISGLKNALMYTAMVLASYMLFSNISFWDRPDSFILLFVCFALFALHNTRGYWQIILIAVALGFCINLKVTSVMYFLPILYLYIKRNSIKQMGIFLFSFLAIAILPFLVSEKCSVNNYLHFLVNISKGMRFSFHNFIIVFQWFLLFMLPLFVFALHNGKKLFHDLYFRSLLILFFAISLTLLLSLKNLEKHHILPFIPVIFYYLILFRNHFKENIFLKSSWLAYFIFILLLFGSQIPGFVKMHRDHLLYDDIYADFNSLVNSNKGKKIMVGYTSADYLYYTFIKDLAVYNGSPMYIDTDVISALEFSKTQYMSYLKELFYDCVPDLIIIPAKGAVFSQKCYFDPQTPMIDYETIDIFKKNYHLIGKTDYFYIYACGKMEPLAAKF